MTSSREINALKILIYRQTHQLPLANNELNLYGQKKSHWSWWAFPTDKPGMSEPAIKLDTDGKNTLPKGKSFVTTATAKILLENPPDSWKMNLEQICKLLEKHKTLNPILPTIDHGRVRHFVKFWSKIDAKPKWFENVLLTLSKY